MNYSNLDDNYIDESKLNNKDYFDNLLLELEEDLFNDIELTEEEDEIINEIEETDYTDCNLIKNINEVETYEKFKPTNPKISTITICAGIDCNFINKEILEPYICKKCFDINVNNRVSHTCVNQVKKKKKGGFYNQQTLLIKIDTGKLINLKIFWNGNVQLTGLKSEEEGIKAINRFIEILKEINQDYKKYNLNYKYNFLVGKNSEEKTKELKLKEKLKKNKLKKTKKTKNIDKKKDEEEKSIIEYVKQDINTLRLINLNVCLINSNFGVNFEIKRNILYQILLNHYKISVSYEPDYYQGVNSKFYWNCNNNKKGYCVCKKKCNGKGKGLGDGDCKKVTVAIFQSGNIIITGAQNYCQIKDAYLFINKVLDEHYDLIKREKFLLKKTDELFVDQMFYINKNNIKNYHLYKELLNK